MGKHPGPGSYGPQTTIDTTHPSYSLANWYDKPIGGSYAASKQNINKMASTLEVGGSCTMSLARDRFINPTEKVRAPAPIAYKISDTIGQKRFVNSPF